MRADNVEGFKKGDKVTAVYFELTSETFAKKHFGNDWQTATIAGTVLKVFQDSCEIRWHDGPMKNSVGTLSTKNGSLTKVNAGATPKETEGTPSAGKHIFAFCKMHICLFENTYLLFDR